MAYKRLLELAENGDIDQLVNGFIEKEGKNFAYFSYATELNNEMEKLQQRIKDLQVCSSPAPRPFMPASENAWGWGGFFIPYLSSITPGPGSHGCAQEKAKGSQKYNSSRQKAACSELKLSQCCHRAPSKNIAKEKSSRKAKSRLGCVQGWLEQEILLVVGCPCSQGTGWSPVPVVQSVGQSATNPTLSVCLCLYRTKSRSSQPTRTLQRAAAFMS